MVNILNNCDPVPNILDNKIEFIVFDDYTIDCPRLNIYSFNIIELKPRFELWGRNIRYVYDVAPSHNNGVSKLIGNCEIDEELFAYLKNSLSNRRSMPI